MSVSEVVLNETQRGSIVCRERLARPGLFKHRSCTMDGQYGVEKWINLVVSFD